ncbi:MAG: biopolymer transporter ExbD [Elusimicrobia bacterium]|jgi:biopolymer transport protein ExbD|nr:biopolymer transporter ExbD [Elusimicrobiota bacterium]
MNEDDMAETEKINVVPLADLTLVLLIILMVLSPMISQSMIRVATPQVASSGQEGQAGPEEKIPLLIAISDEGYRLNNMPFENLNVLFTSLHERLAADRERPVLVSAADDVFVGKVVEVLDGVKQMGAGEVSLVKNVVPGKKK